MCVYMSDMQGMDRGYLYFPFYQAPSGSVYINTCN